MIIQQTKRLQREDRILSSLDELTYATREQLQIINDLKGARNAQYILRRMEQDGLINAVRYDKKVYFLSSSGKQRIGSAQGVLKKSHIKHTLMRNDLYIRLGMPKDWRKEREIVWEGGEIIMDASFKKNGEFHFVEIDNQQSMSANIDKIARYKELSGVIFRQFKHTPTLIWYTLSDVRKRKLKEACEKAGVKFVIY